MNADKPKAKSWSERLTDLVGGPLEDYALSGAMSAADWIASKTFETSRRRHSALKPLKLIAHRGAWRERGCLENTFKAFDRARESGVWGLEFDVRFTKDDIPIVHHDETLLRTFGRPLEISNMTLSTLQHEAPEIPTLQAVIEEYSAAMHLMIEIKGTRDDFSGPRLKKIAELISALKAEEQYHLMSMEPEMLQIFKDHVGIPKSALVTIGSLKPELASDIALENGYKGFTCHWLAMTSTLLHRHHSVGQSCGVGFAASKPSLHREWARGVDWVFTNHAPEAAEWLNEIETREIGTR